MYRDQVSLEEGIRIGNLRRRDGNCNKKLKLKEEIRVQYWKKRLE